MNKILLEKLEKETSYGYSYQIIKDDVYPKIENITAVSILIMFENKIFLTKNKRGRELPGGHIEKDEKIIDTLKREIKEEVGTNIKLYNYWGYKKIIHKIPISNRNGGFYPFPFGYILYFFGESTGELLPITGEEILDKGLFTYEEALLKMDNIDTKEVFKLIYNNQF